MMLPTPSTVALNSSRVPADRRMLLLRPGHCPLLLVTLLLHGCASQLFSLDGENFQTPRSASRGIASVIGEKVSGPLLPTDLPARLPSGLPMLGPTPLLIGPTITTASGEITKSGRELQTFLLLDLKSQIPDHPVERLGGDIPAAGANVLTGTVRYERPNPKTPDENWFVVALTLSDKNGLSIGEATFRINARQFDPTPSRFFQNSPIFVASAVAKDQRQTVTQPTAKALELAARADHAIVAYEANQFDTARQSFQEIIKSDADNLLALSGLYQSSLALGRQADAQQALDLMIDAGFKTGVLSFKFMFRVRSAEFRDDFAVAREYPRWIERLAARFSRSSACLRIEGHASRSGSIEHNTNLSLKRAQRVAEMFISHNPALAKRVQVAGKGYANNIVGSGTDDATDAIDRRVEFHLSPCRE
jgi:outer membrane protein OmpA-like peptidoglycan-associated protein